ncbi:MAG: hypothetical protein GY906_04585 [bacterium]|nr:hypothetical protein [bacterium]
MGHLKQRRDEVAARFYTPDYRVYGTIFLIPGRSTADLLNMDQNNFIPVIKSQVFAPGIDHPPLQNEFLGQVRFAGLNREQVLWVLGGRPAEPSTVAQKELKVSFIFPNYLVAGTINVPSNQRLTDLLYTSGHFVSALNVQVFPWDGKTPFGQLSGKSRYDFATINLRNTLSVVELG